MLKDPPHFAEAYAAWMSSGSIGLGLWLANYKERTTGRRNYTTEEYGIWVADCKRRELSETGINSEFCQWGIDYQHARAESLGRRD